MLAWGLAQLAGSLTLLWQPSLPHPGVFLLSLPFALAMLSQRRWRWLAAFWLGASLATWQAERHLDDRLDMEYDGEVFEVRGRIIGLVERDERRQRFRFRIESGEIGGHVVDLPNEVRLSIYEPLDIATGERWQWRVKLRRPRGFSNRGGFDYERWLFVEGIGATGYVRHPAGAQRLSAASGEWRASIAARVAQLAEGAAAGLIRGLATGDRGGITDEQWELLRATGTAHLMAISGLHVGLVAGLVLAVAGVVRRRWFAVMASWWPPLLGGAVALFYGALAGFGLPIRRALAGLAVLLAALAWRRVLAPGHAIGLALTVVLCLDPLAALTSGFWLSFGAVAAIVVMLAGRRPRGSRPRQALMVQGGMFLLMAPLIAANFGQLPLVSPVANLVAIPLFAFVVVPLVLVGLLLLPWPPGASAVFWLAGNILELLVAFLETLATVDPGLSLPQSGLAGWICVAAGMLLLALPRAWFGRTLAPWLLLPALWPITAPMMIQSAAVPPLAVHFLDVGQGLAVVVETPSGTLVYDTGPGFGGSDAASMVVIPFLQARGREPDVVLVSHGHDDHAGGLASLTNRYPDAERLGRVDAPDVSDCAGQSWRWDSVEFKVLHPAGYAVTGDNDDSCVLRIEAGDFSVLLTGDIEAAAESRLLRDSPAMLVADVALVPHHGSRTSSTRAFARKVAPRLAVAAAGHGNRWGFPKGDVVERWEEAGAVVLSTGGQGAISVFFDGETARVESHRDRRRPWRDTVVRQGSLVLPVR